MRMTPGQYFAIQERSPPPLSYDIPRREKVEPLAVGRAYVINEVPTIPTNGVDHTGLIIGVVAIVGIVGLVILGLAYLSRKD